MSSVKSVLVPDQVQGSDCDDHPRKTKTGIQDCVSANKVVVVVPLPGILVLVRWSLTTPSWLTTSWYKILVVALIQRGFVRILCYLKPNFREQGGTRVMRGSVHLYVTDQDECSTEVIGHLAQRELWVI